MVVHGLAKSNKFKPIEPLLTMNNDKAPFSRRDFVKAAALSGAGMMIVPRHVIGGPGYTAPSDQVNLGIIGAGGKGKQNAQELPIIQLENV